MSLVAFHLKAIRELCVEFRVVRLEAFGSASVGPFDPVDSDLDVLVEFPDGYDYGSWGCHLAEFENRLAEIVDRPVDVITPRQIRNPYFALAVNRSRRLLYGTPPTIPPESEGLAATDPTNVRALKLLLDIRTAAQNLVEETAGLSLDDLLRETRLRLFAELRDRGRGGAAAARRASRCLHTARRRAEDDRNP